MRESHKTRIRFHERLGNDLGGSQRHGSSAAASGGRPHNHSSPSIDMPPPSYTDLKALVDAHGPAIINGTVTLSPTLHSLALHSTLSHLALCVSGLGALLPIFVSPTLALPQRPGCLTSLSHKRTLALSRSLDLTATFLPQRPHSLRRSVPGLDTQAQGPACGWWAHPDPVFDAKAGRGPRAHGAPGHRDTAFCTSSPSSSSCGGGGGSRARRGARCSRTRSSILSRW